jgi:hypothetical protein
MSKRQTSIINKRGTADALRSKGFTVYRYFADVPPTLATATTLGKQGLRITDETPIIAYVLSGDANRTYCLFKIDDPTLKQKRRRVKT